MRPESARAVPHSGLRRGCSRGIGLGGSALDSRAAEFIDRSRHATDSVTLHVACSPSGRQRPAIASTVESSSPNEQGSDLGPKPDAADCPLCNRSHSDRARPGVTRVLVVEDDAAIANLIAYNLERSGHHVTVVSDGAEALRRLRQSAPDLVVLDLLLPLRSGWQVLREMRSGTGSLAAVPVLLVTALACERLARDLAHLGAQGLLGKPFAVTELCRAARELIDARRYAAALSS